MVKKLGDNYQCEQCCYVYNDKGSAKKCEDWCKKHHSCNLEITVYAIKK